MRSPRHWPSLDVHVELATDVFGPDAGPPRVAEWLELQIDRITDADFAEQFAAHVSLPGIAAADYAHRHVQAAAGELLGGIRFYGRDIERPFVEVVAHTFTEIDALADCVRSEWSGFGTRFLRLRTAPGSVRGAAILDETIHLARYCDMTPPDGRVTLAAFARDPSEISRSEAFAQDEHLSRNISSLS